MVAGGDVNARLGGVGVSRGVGVGAAAFLNGGGVLVITSMQSAFA